VDHAHVQAYRRRGLPERVVGQARHDTAEEAADLFGGGTRTRDAGEGDVEVRRGRRDRRRGSVEARDQLRQRPPDVLSAVRGVVTEETLVRCAASQIRPEGIDLMNQFRQ
jgi:hypothetical protein